MLDQSAPSQQAPSQQSVLNIASWLVEAFTSHQAGRLADAERLYKQILAAQPDHSDSLYLLSAISYQRGDYAQALSQIDLALTINSGNSLLWNQRGLALQRLQRFDDALASYDRALAGWPDHAETLCNRGVALYELKRFDEALASYDRALAVRPHYAEALCYRGSALLALKRQEEALASYDGALAIQPAYAEALSYRGDVLVELKRPEEALASYDQALAIAPDNAERLCNRGVALYELKRTEEALASYDRGWRWAWILASCTTIGAMRCFCSSSTTRRWRASSIRSSDGRTMPGRIATGVSCCMR